MPCCMMGKPGLPRSWPAGPALWLPGCRWAVACASGAGALLGAALSWDSPPSSLQLQAESSQSHAYQVKRAAHQHYMVPHFVKICLSPLLPGRLGGFEHPRGCAEQQEGKPGWGWVAGGKQHLLSMDRREEAVLVSLLTKSLLHRLRRPTRLVALV